VIRLKLPSFTLPLGASHQYERKALYECVAAGLYRRLMVAIWMSSQIVLGCHGLAGFYWLGRNSDGRVVM
jgi:hypothetical protein